MNLVLPEWPVFTGFLLIPRYSAGYAASAHEEGLLPPRKRRAWRGEGVRLQADQRVR